jgi:hypothetical protein
MALPFVAHVNARRRKRQRFRQRIHQPQLTNPPRRKPRSSFVMTGVCFSGPEWGHAIDGQAGAHRWPNEQVGNDSPFCKIKTRGPSKRRQTVLRFATRTKNPTRNGEDDSSGGWPPPFKRFTLCRAVAIKLMAEKMRGNSPQWGVIDPWLRFEPSAGCEVSKEEPKNRPKQPSGSEQYQHSKISQSSVPLGFRESESEESPACRPYYKPQCVKVLHHRKGRTASTAATASTAFFN